MNNSLPQSPVSGRRRDFERNRETILRAADECFSELGPRVPIDVIAKRAGFSPATVYRHFPSREDLEKAVFEVRVNAYAAVIEQAQETDDEYLAFRQTMHGLVAMQARDRSFRDLIDGDQQRLAESPGMSRFSAAFFAMFERARRESVIREDVHNEDVMLLLLASEGVARTAAAFSDDALRRVVDIALDGLCAQQSELTGSSLSWQQLIDATRT